MLSSAQLLAVYVPDEDHDRGRALLAVQAAVLADARSIIEASLSEPAPEPDAEPDADGVTVDPPDTDASLDRLAAVLDRAYASGAVEVIFNPSGAWTSLGDKIDRIEGTMLTGADLVLWARAARIGHPRFTGDANTPFFSTPDNRTRAAFVRAGLEQRVSFRKTSGVIGARIVSIRPMTEEELADAR